MTLQEIKTSVESGKIVYWSNKNYIVKKDSSNNWFIKCQTNNTLSYLTYADDLTLIENENKFFINI